MDEFIPIKLPSNCLTYKDQEGNPVNPETIAARAYQGSDQIYLTQINPLNLERNYFEVLKSVLKGVDPIQLTLGDRMYLILWEYINSYDRMIKIKTVCSNCLSEVEISVDLTSLENKELCEGFEQPYSIILPVSKEKISLKLLTVEDEIEVEKYSKKHKKDAMLYRYARTIVSDMDIIAQVQKLSKMKSKDLLAIMAFQDDFHHGPILETTFVCPMEDCGEEDEVKIPFRSDFFFPEVSQFSVSNGKGI